MPQWPIPDSNASKAELQTYARIMREKSERDSLESFIRSIVRDEMKKSIRDQG